MPNSLETIIRPFQTLDTSPIPGVASIPAPAQNAFLFVTGNGQIKSGSFNYSYSFTTYADAKQKEVTDTGNDFQLNTFLPAAI